MTPSPVRADGRLLAALGLAGAAVAVLTIGALHLLAASTVDPIRRTISEYALGDHGWLFDVGVLALAAGAAAVLVALVRTGRVRVLSPAVLLYGVGVLGLVLVVAFEKTNWAVGPSLSGTIHRWSSLLVFVALPLAVLLMGRALRARWVAALGAGTLAWMAAILAGIPLGPVLGRPWWQVWPLGLMERGLALTLVAAVVALGVWTVRQQPAATITA
ncbi:DUF998 domain-containing protein [Pseudonocardia sp. CA-107938]|uniref:DUF998 domain-containing protein n=1 Tax=Pseudonocardia sp. CA-107938 TaxID=3240021 RepID=UPI003D8A11CA